MSKTNVLSTILVVVFMISCLSFFNASASEEGIVTTTGAPVVETVETMFPEEPTLSVDETTLPTEETTIVETTLATETQSTTMATVADPVYTETTQTSKTTTETTTQQTQSYTQYYDYYGGTKATKEINTTKATEPTTPKKNITNYASEFRPLKWISFILMIGSAAALIFVNVRYKKVHGSSSKKRSRKGSRLDTNARFSNSKNNLDQTAVVDLSSFSKKNENSDVKFNQKLVDDDFNKSKDDDLYL